MRRGVAVGLGLVLATLAPHCEPLKTMAALPDSLAAEPSAATAVATFRAEIATDIAQLEAAYAQAFPGLPAHDLARGVAAIDADVARAQAEIEAFPPYEFLLEEGRAALLEPFPDAAHYQDCFSLAPAALRTHYPRFDTQTGAVVTLEQALNACRQQHGLTPLVYGSSELNALSAYLSFLARGQPLRPPSPESQEAMREYRHGRAIFYRRQGQLELACADCHVRAVGKHLRDVRLGPAIGVVGASRSTRCEPGASGACKGAFKDVTKSFALKPCRSNRATTAPWSIFCFRSAPTTP